MDATARRLFALLALPLAQALAQATPSGGAITRYVPPAPTPASFISDQSAVLTSDQHTALHARIAAIQAAGFGDIAVAILPSIGDYSANQVAVEIHRTWKVGSTAAVGSARRDVGVLLLIVPKELAPNGRGECWINTGLGAEGIITDATAGTICRDSIIPHLRKRDYASAVGAGIGAIEARLRSDAGLVQEDASPASRRAESFPLRVIATVLGGVASIFAGVFGFLKWRRRRPRACPRCGLRMRRLDERADDAGLQRGQVVEEQVGSIDYDVWSCGCGEQLVVPYRKLFTRYTDCRECRRRTARGTRETLTAATTLAAGLAEDRFACKACGAAWSVQVVLPIITAGSSGGSGGGSGGGGGSSFGGSGASSGGGGGSSY